MRGKKLSLKEQNAKLLNDKNERKKIFKDLVNHVKTGYSLDCFGPISEHVVRKFLKEYPEEFIEEELIQATREGKQYWEGIGNRQAAGECLGNSRSWYYNMANRYGWREKIDIEAEHKGNVNVNIVSYASRKAPTDAPQ
jgi:hypothetical protein